MRASPWNGRMRPQRLEQRPQVGTVFVVQRHAPAAVHRLVVRHAEETAVFLVDELHAAARARHPHHHRRLVRHGAEALLALAQRLAPLGDAAIERLVQLAQLFLGPPAFGDFQQQRPVGHRQLAALAMQLHEDRHLRPQHGGVDRLVQVVHGTGAVAGHHILILVVERGEEDDRHRRRLLPLLDQVRQLEPAHVGHADVEDEQPEVLGHQRQQRVVGAGGAHQAVAGIVEDRLEHLQVGGLVVDDEDVDAAVGDDRGQRAALRLGGGRGGTPEGTDDGVRRFAVHGVSGRATPASATGADRC
jgi:hypothetical protein